MRWSVFIIVAALVIVAQSALAPTVAVAGVRPDWLITMAVFLGLFARREDAVIGAWIIGTMADLLTVERFGLMGLSYGLTALVVGGIREFVFRDLLSTQIALTLVLCLIVRTIWCAYRTVLYGTPVWFSAGFLLETLGVTLYTAIWSPLLHRLLVRSSAMLGLPRPRYTYSGMHRFGAAHV